MPYFISCDACAYQAVVRDESEVLERREEHESEYGSRHSFEVESIEEQPLFRGGNSTPW